MSVYARGVAVRSATVVALTALAYYAAARVGYRFAIPRGIVTLWPPSGLMLGLLLSSNRRDWRAIVLGGLLGSFLSDRQSGYTIGLATLAAIANGGETLTAAWFVDWRLGRRITLESLRDVGTLVIGAVVLSNAATAFAGVLVLHTGFHTAIGTAWFTWWAGDGLGMLIVAPVVIAVLEVRFETFRIARTTEAALTMAALVAVAQLALGPQQAWAGGALRPFAVLPFLLWAGFRFGSIGAAVGVLLVAAVGTWNAALGVGAFADAGISPVQTALQTYIYLSVASLSALVPAAMMAERAAAAEDLRDSEGRYRAVVDAATDAIVSIDAHSRVQFASPAIREIFGYSPEEILGRELTVLMPEPLRQRHRGGIARYLATGTATISWRGVRLTGLRRDGSEVPIEVSFGVRGEGESRVFTGIIRDTSGLEAAARALRETEERFRQSQKMEAIGQLAGGVAHDFNNLLTVIAGNGAILREELTSSNSATAEVDEILAAADRAAALTRQLLAFGRRELVAPRALDLSQCLRGIESMLRRLIGEHIELVVHAPEHVGSIVADAGEVEQVILNLALNARDAMPNGGVLTIATSNVEVDDAYRRSHALMKSGPYAMLTVSDTGVGMDASTAARVFEPFYTTKPPGKGTGLGLSTVYGIAARSGGVVTVYSEPGRGSTLRVYFPREGVAPASLPVEAAPQSNGGDETLLVVEDDSGIRKIATRILKSAGYSVMVAETAASAIRLLEAHGKPVDLLLTDVVLPGQSGRALYEQLRERFTGLRVLYMSGYTDDMIVRHGVMKGDAAFLQKPFTQASLLDAVRRAIDA